MAFLTISAAARAAGKDRGTIKRYLQNGRLSSTKDATGNVRIDPSELLRVFGELKTNGSIDVVQAATRNTSEDSSIHQLTIETLREQLRVAQEREEWLKSQLENEQQRSRELEQRMLPSSTEEKKGFFKILFG